MNVLELQNDNFEIVGLREDLIKYLKETLIKYIQEDDFEALSNTDLREYADLLEHLVKYGEDDTLLKISFVECAMGGTATPYLYELTEKRESIFEY